VAIPWLLIFGRISKSSDARGKTMGSFLPDGTHVNHTLVKDGWCCMRREIRCWKGWRRMRERRR